MDVFKIHLDTPPQGGYFPGTMITGMVLFKNDIPRDYKQILIEFCGRADVQCKQNVFLSESDGYRSKRIYIHRVIILWDKHTNGHGGRFPVGMHHFNFSIPTSRCNFPASFNGKFGSVTYTLKAKVVSCECDKLSQYYDDVTDATAVNILKAIPIDHPDLMKPLLKQVQKHQFLSFASASIVITGRVPRRGFCIVYDRIPLEVSVENGSGRTIQRIQVSLEESVVYKAQGCNFTDIKHSNPQVITSEPIKAHSSMKFHPDPVAIPETFLTYSGCELITVNYFLKITAIIRWAVNPCLYIPVIIGNVPYSVQDQSPPSYIDTIQPGTITI